MNPWVNALADQMHRSWQMLRLLMKVIPDKEWFVGPSSERIPAVWAFHAVVCADWYARPNAKSVGEPWDDDSPDPRKRPTRKQLLAYLDEVEARIDTLLRSSTEEELLGENACKWTGANPYERMIYVLRHNHQHIGELQEITRERGLRAGKWK